MSELRYFKRKGVTASYASVSGEAAVWNYSTDDNYEEITQEQFLAEVYPNGVPEIDVPDGDECPNCLSRNTERIDVIVSDPEVWHCECGYCGHGFEVVIGEYGHDAAQG